MSKKLTALFEYYWLPDSVISILKESGIDIKVYLVDDEPEMRIDISSLSDIQEFLLYTALVKNITNKIKNKEYTWLILYQ